MVGGGMGRAEAGKAKCAERGGSGVVGWGAEVVGPLLVKMCRRPLEEVGVC